MKENNQIQFDDEILIAITDGIGGILGREVRRKYYESKNQLLANKKFIKYDEKTKQFALDILALGVFHKLIILPINGANSFWNNLHCQEITSVKMRKNSYVQKDFLRMKTIADQFISILNKRKLSISLFNYDNLDIFMNLVNDFIDGTNDEEEWDSMGR